MSVSRDAELLDAAASVLADGGVKRFTLERVATAANRSRATIWRQGVTVEALLDGLLERLADDYRSTLWPVLTAADSPDLRIERAMRALCEVADRHLAVLQADDELFHLASSRRPGNFVEPFEKILREGAADGSIPRGSDDAAELAVTLFNVVVWPYVHMRTRHGWPAGRSADDVVGLALRGVLERPA
jgi:AcrR family transcriptional regulator